MTKSFDVFLSHNSKDKPAVRELAEALRARGLKVWLDEWELIPGRPWQEALEEIIETCRSSAVLVGKDGFGPWHAAEMRGCLTEFVDRKLPVIPVLLPDAPEKPTLPIFLKGFTWVDMRGGLTEERLDLLQWGVTGRKPDPEPKQPIPEADTDPALATLNLGTPAGSPPSTVRESGHRVIAGHPFTEPLTGIRFLWIPGGQFQMGGKFDWLTRVTIGDSEPIHWVKVSPFWLGETPVTNRQYAVFIEKIGGREPKTLRDPRFSSPDQPVVDINWEEAYAFTKWLDRALGINLLLPSEAQWEFAARGTDGREYPWGNDPPDTTRACFGLGGKNQGQPAPVGSCPAGRGPFGTLDQVGNVSEWCWDHWDRKAYIMRWGEHVWADPVVRKDKETWQRPIRGGCWNDRADSLRAAYRRSHPAHSRSIGIGFRVVAYPQIPRKGLLVD